MNKPKMIMFDAGKTLIDYLPKIDDKGMSYLSTIDATKILMNYIISNPNNYDAEIINKYNNEIFDKYSKCRKELYEINNQVILKTLFDTLDIKFSISLEEIERIIWNNSADIISIEGTKELLDELNKKKIRTAVISNLDFSGYLLEERLNTLLPNNKFEFVIASSDYGIRKPQSLLFEVGITKSGLEPKEIWYVGDKFQVDVIGSKTVGMTPVWFKGNKDLSDGSCENVLVIDDYRELIEILSKI